MSDHWHADRAIVARYTSNALDRASAASVEQHLIACESCRALVSSAVPSARLELVWSRVRAEADRPRGPFIARILKIFGVRDHIVRLISATPSLTASWLSGVAFTLFWGVILAHAGRHSSLPFLVIAPMVPLAGVAAAYGPRLDPMYEIGVASPMSGFRLFILRSGTVLLATLLLTGIASAGLPDLGWRAAAWLAPALAVTLAAGALATWLPGLTSALLVAGGWLAFSAAGYSIRTGHALNRFAAFEPNGQIVVSVVAVVAAIVLGARARSFDRGDA